MDREKDMVPIDGAAGPSLKMKTKKGQSESVRRDNLLKYRMNARVRRENESTEILRLAKLLPLPLKVAYRLDQASVIRLTSSHLKMRNFFPDGLDIRPPSVSDCAVTPENRTKEHFDKRLGKNVLQCLDGFLFLVGSNGRIIYISETASVYLGFTQYEIIGKSIYDCIHPDDQAKMVTVLNRYHPPTNLPSEKTFQDSNVSKLKRLFYLRVKCVLDKRKSILSSAKCKVIHCSGYLKLKEYPGLDVLVAVGHPISSSSFSEIIMHSNMFMFRASLDLKIMFVESRVAELTGYNPQDLIEKTIYQYIHAGDILNMRLWHQILISKGKVKTNYYRLLAKNGGWVWIQSSATIIQTKKKSNPNLVVCVNHVLSEFVEKDVCLSVTNSGSMTTHTGTEDMLVQNTSGEPQPNQGHSNQCQMYRSPAVTNGSCMTTHTGTEETMVQNTSGESQPNQGYYNETQRYQSLTAVTDEKCSYSNGGFLNDYVSDNSESHPTVNGYGHNYHHQPVNMVQTSLNMDQEYELNIDQYEFPDTVYPYDQGYVYPDTFYPYDQSRVQPYNYYSDYSSDGHN